MEVLQIMSKPYICGRHAFSFNQVSCHHLSMIFIKGFQFLEASSLIQRLSFKGSLCQVHPSWGWELVLHMIPTHRKQHPFIFQVFHVKTMEVLLTFTSLENTSTDEPTLANKHNWVSSNLNSK